MERDFGEYGSDFRYPFVPLTNKELMSKSGKYELTNKLAIEKAIQTFGIPEDFNAFLKAFEHPLSKYHGLDKPTI